VWASAVARAMAIASSSGDGGPYTREGGGGILDNKRSDTDLGNTQSAPRGGERERLCARPSRP